MFLSSFDDSLVLTSSAFSHVLSSVTSPLELSVVSSSFSSMTAAVSPAVGVPPAVEMSPAAAVSPAVEVPPAVEMSPAVEVSPAVALPVPKSSAATRL